MSAPPGGPLAGLRVIDLTTVIMGPLGARILADMGADVIKVEPPEGDAFRRIGPMRSPGMGGSVLNLHRNKRSVCLDLKDPRARDALDRLIASADALVHNLRPQAAQALRLDWPSLQAVNPRLVCCAARGFGHDGPYGHKAAYDDLIQAGCGFVALNQQVHGKAMYAPTAWCDKIAGQAIAYAVLGALLHRERGGGGQEVEVPMFETAVDFMLVEHFGAGAFEPPLGPMGYPRQLAASRKPYATLDGLVCLLPYTDRNWADFLAFVGRPELIGTGPYRDFATRTARVDEVNRLIEDEAARRSTAQWLAFCDGAGIPCLPVLALDELPDDPHVRAVGLMQTAHHPTEGDYRALRSPLRFSATPYALRHHAPRPGAHTHEVLRDVGVSEADLRALAPEGPVEDPASGGPAHG